MNNTQKNLRWPLVRIEENAKVRASLISSLTGESLIRVISQAVLSLPLPETKTQVKLEAEEE